MRTNRLAIFSFCALLIALGCHRRVPLTTLPPAPPAPPAPTPAAAPPSPAALALDDAERAFSAGSYDEASRSYENYLRLNPAGGARDQALFRLGLAYALRPAADWPRASGAFRQLIEGFPDSPYRQPASLILSLRSELDQSNASAQQRDQRIRQLTAELDQLKKIDAERRKRP